MKVIDENIGNEVRLWQEKLFQRSIRRNRKLARVIELLGNTANQACLEICEGDGVISAKLRELGGNWKTAVSTEKAAVSLQYSIPEKISLISNAALPFEDHTFDAVVIIDALKGIANDQGFIRECHRALKTDGRLIILEKRRRTPSVSALLQRLLGVSPKARGLKRNGYARSELFNILKDGFDVPETIYFSNGLVESAGAIGEFVQKVMLHDHYWLPREQTGQEEFYRYEKLYFVAGFTYPLMWLFSKLEFLPGHQLAVKTKRRSWRPRQQPVLIDGRSIAEAAINTKIGTAAPF
ncbi:MAG: methyltransferase domain-containing protein [Kiritimatiellales bacterium]|nr:methyltransferase domain-containing protein [Kiritimatiellales bacterium]